MERADFRGDWQPFTEYYTRQVVTNGGTLYRAALDQVSGATFDANLWVSLGAFSGGGGGGAFIDVTAAPYSADKTGATGAFDAVQAAVTAALAAGGGIVYLPAGTYLWSGTAGPSTMTLPANLTHGQVTIKGDGKYATTVKLSTSRPTFIGAPNGGDFGRFTIEDLTIDNNNVPSPNFNYTGVVASLTGSGNVSDITLRRVDTINVGNSITSGTERRNFDITCGNTPYDTTTLYSVTRIKVQDCNFGRSGGGGNYGVVLQGYTAGTNRMANKTVLGNPPLINVYFDDIDIDGLTWAAGNTPTSLVIFSGSGVMVGGSGFGDRVKVRNCKLGQSTDNCIEIDSMRDVLIENCTMFDSITGGLFLVNLGGISNPSSQTIKVRNCRYILNARNATNGSGVGFWTNCNTGSPFGSVLLEDCVFEQTGAVPVLPGFFLYGDYKLLSVKRCRTVYRAGTITYTGNSQGIGLNGLRVLGTGGRGRVVIEDFQLRAGALTLTTGTFTGPRVEPSAVQIDQMSDYDIDVRGVSMSLGTMTVVGTNTPSFRSMLVYLHPSQTTARTDTFTTATRITNDYFDDTGQLANVLTTGGVLTSTASHALERRFAWVSDSSDFNYGVVGPYTDGAAVIKFNPATALTGFKAGAIKRIASDTYLESYVVDDGTNSLLCLDKVISGTRTSLLGAIVGGGAGTVTALDTTALGTAGAPAGSFSDRGVVLAARLANATAGWVRIKNQADLVTAEYFTSAPASVSTAGTSAATATLLTTDREQFVGMQGRPGFSWVAMDATSTLDDMTYQRMNVIRGRIAGLTFGDMQTRVSDGYAVRFGQTSSTVRFTQLEIDDVDASAARGAVGGFTDISGYDTTQGQSIRRQRIQYGGTVPAPAAITPSGSPYTYTNQDAYTEDVYVYSGTLTTPFVEVARGQSGTFGQVLGATGPALVRLEPGDQVRVTYSSVPTMRKVPVL